MANIPKVDGNFKLEETSTSQTYTDTLYTDNKNISGDIEISITAKTGTAGTPVATKGTVSGNKVTVTPKVTNVEGWISSGTISGTGVTVTASELVSGTKTISANGTGIDVTNYASVNVSVPTGITPTGTITITQKTGTNVTNYASANVQEGSATASATKGTVSGNKVSVTPKVTKSAGWIDAGTVSGTAVEVTAAELVSGSKSISSNSASIDVTNYQYVDVAVPTGITPTGTITLTQQTGTNVTNYASANVRAAGNFSLSATDNTGVVTVGSLASGYYPLTNSITASLSAGTPGWFSSGSANDSSVQVGKMAAATPTAEVSSLSSPTVAVSGAVTGMETASSGSYYVTVNGSATNGSVKSKYKNTQTGYAPANTSGTESAATTITPNVTGSGTKIYIKSCTITNNTSGGSSSGTINRGSQIKIGQGYNASDKYYTAQANSGTVTIANSGNTSCDGKTNVSVPAGSASQPTTSHVATSVSFDNTTSVVTLEAKVTPSVSAGWVSSGTSGTVTILGEVPYESKTCTPSASTQTILPTSGKILSQVTVDSKLSSIRNIAASSSNIYLINGKCILTHSSSAGTKSVELTNTLFKVTSTGNAGFTYQVPNTTLRQSTATFTSSSGWTTMTVTNSGASDWTFSVKYEPNTLCKCNNSYLRSLNISTHYPLSANDVNIYTNPGDVLLVYAYAKDSTGSQTYYSIINGERYLKCTKCYATSSSSQYSHTSLMQIKFAYSDDNVNWDSEFNVGAERSGAGSSSSNSQSRTITKLWFNVSEVYN